jgi:circadian clock protein KaiB
MTAAGADRWALTLYVNGASTNSLQAIETVRCLCDEELGGQVELEVIDVQQQPALVLRDQVVAAPTLVKRLPGPLRRIVGDLSDTDRLRLGLALGPVGGDEAPDGGGSLDRDG